MNNSSKSLGKSLKLNQACSQSLQQGDKRPIQSVLCYQSADSTAQDQLRVHQKKSNRKQMELHNYTETEAKAFKTGRCTLWNTLTIQKVLFIPRRKKQVTVELLSEIITDRVPTIPFGHYFPNVIRGHCYSTLLQHWPCELPTYQTSRGRHGRSHKTFFAHARV